MKVGTRSARPVPFARSAIVVRTRGYRTRAARPYGCSFPSPSSASGSIFQDDSHLQQLIAQAIRLFEVSVRARGVACFDQFLDVGVERRFGSRKKIED